MTDQILEKLNKHISNGIDREADVVYLLVQIRKLLERDKEGGKFRSLDLYCDWILHADICWNINRNQILDRIEEVINLLETSGDKDNQGEIIKKINEAISFDKFYVDLKSFFTEKNLVFFSDEKYIILLRLLLEILKDIPLIAKNNRFKFSFTSGNDVHSFHARIELSDKSVFRSPMTQKVTNWAAGAVMPSGAYESEDLDKKFPDNDPSNSP